MKIRKIIMEMDDRSQEELTKGIVASFKGDEMVVEMVDCSKFDLVRMAVGFVTVVDKLGLGDFMKAFAKGEVIQNMPDMSEDCVKVASEEIV